MTNMVLESIIFFMFTIISAWSIYNVILFFAGLFSRLKKGTRLLGDELYEPRVSIIIPVKNGEKVLPRLVDSILRIDYPSEKLEVVFVEDGSTDKSYELCLRYSMKYPRLVKVIHRDVSRGKPDALAYVTKYTSGDVLAIFDVDSVIKPDAIRQAVKYLKHLDIAAVQGKTSFINAGYNLLTNLISIEETWYSIILEGRYALGLFVPLTGSCMFIKRECLEKAGGWNPDSLVEDMELSIRLLLRNFKIVYSCEVESYQEIPSSFKDFYIQRRRWYRGFIETLLSTLRLSKKLGLKIIDALVLLLSPLILVLTQLFCLSLPLIVLLKYNSPLLQIMFQFLVVFLIVSMLMATIILFTFTKWRKKSLLLAMSIYFYWWLLGLIVLRSIGDILLRTKREWVTTTKRGIS